MNAEVGFTPTMRVYARQLDAAHRHAAAEGVDVDDMVVLDSYDRQIHPLAYNWRAEDIIAGLEAVDLPYPPKPLEACFGSVAFGLFLLWQSTRVASGADLLLGSSALCLVLAVASLYKSYADAEGPDE